MVCGNPGVGCGPQAGMLQVVLPKWGHIDLFVSPRRFWRHSPSSVASFGQRSRQTIPIGLGNTLENGWCLQSLNHHVERDSRSPYQTFRPHRKGSLRDRRSLYPQIAAWSKYDISSSSSSSFSSASTSTAIPVQTRLRWVFLLGKTSSFDRSLPPHTRICHQTLQRRSHVFSKTPVVSGRECFAALLLQTSWSPYLHTFHFPTLAISPRHSQS